MLISPEETSVLYLSVQLLDTHDESVLDFVWFNTDTMVAAVQSLKDVSACGRVEISNFSFEVGTETDAAIVKSHLPAHLHEKVLVLNI